MSDTQYIIGIDEVGRGPVAGPVAVGLVLCSNRFDPTVISGLKDSKQLSATERLEIYHYTLPLVEGRQLNFTVSFVSPAVIDRQGISWALHQGVIRGLNRLTRQLHPKDIFVYLDGGLKAPKRFHQKTVIKGDQKMPVIALASVLAKVKRDRRMENYSRKYPKYGFEQHKGYGTPAHLETVKRVGMSPIHRRSFLQNTLPGTDHDLYTEI